ncbi:hypothetical protein LOY38_13540 [Pseudomonas sp. B21-015]|uniref:hypothetical protein n=1 Tax=Pseudomonas sp. B21-015 TaxID=2895473 RepID=UPI00215E7683|nr:hypothetical protein [Pseudomonas sp. B21-015]UVM52972.1 hypothetical protein LOY38_13540 [Pseudomonas sp. B21-015]
MNIIVFFHPASLPLENFTDPVFHDSWCAFQSPTVTASPMANCSMALTPSGMAIGVPLAKHEQQQKQV